MATIYGMGASDEDYEMTPLDKKAMAAAKSEYAAQNPDVAWMDVSRLERWRMWQEAVAALSQEPK